VPAALVSILLVLVVFSPPSRATDDNPWTLVAYFENDLFTDTDESYTNGVRMSWISPDVSSYEHDPGFPGFISKINDRLRFFHDLNVRDCGDPSADPQTCLQRNLVISLGQLMFTPEDYLATELVEDDRPYAGYLYSTFGYHTRDDAQLDTIEVTFGIVGPASLAQQTQDFIHHLRDIPVFKGWDNQLKNEPVFQLLYEHKERLVAGRLLRGWSPPRWLPSEWHPRYDLIGHLGANVGNAMIYANLGFEYRIGLGLPNDFGSAALRPGGDNSAPGRWSPRKGDVGTPRPAFETGSLHLFASFDGRAVARDIFLDGNTFRDSHSVSKEYFVGDMSVGIGLIYHRWKVSLARVWRSEEFAGQNEPHQFGSISVSFIY
jgi:hypothetical protein